MTRVLSGAVLIALAVGVVWFAPPVVFVAVAEILLLLAFVEYSRLAAACGLPIPVVPAGVAPVISPKKTIEGAIGGFVFGAILMVALGAWWLPAMPIALRAMLGVTLVALGIAGDLFESMLKRSANVKDSSTLIPGHGGILDRIDALLFAAPVYYVVLKYV